LRFGADRTRNPSFNDGLTLLGILRSVLDCFAPLSVLKVICEPSADIYGAPMLGALPSPRLDHSVRNHFAWRNPLCLIFEIGFETKVSLSTK
jgi:hypothetical protein